MTVRGGTDSDNTFPDPSLEDEGPVFRGETFTTFNVHLKRMVVPFYVGV